MVICTESELIEVVDDVNCLEMVEVLGIKGWPVW